MPDPSVSFGGRRWYSRGSDPYGLAPLLTVSNWLLQRAGGIVVEHQRAALLQRMAGAEHLAVEIVHRPRLLIRVIGDGAPLLEVPVGD